MTTKRKAQLDRACTGWQQARRVVFHASSGDATAQRLAHELHADHLRTFAGQLDTLVRRVRDGGSWKARTEDLATQLQAYGEAGAAQAVWRLTRLQGWQAAGDLEDIVKDLHEQAELSEHGVECRRCGFRVLPDDAGTCAADTRRPHQLPAVSPDDDQLPPEAHARTIGEAARRQG